jgi:hypothetical protein
MIIWLTSKIKKNISKKYICDVFTLCVSIKWKCKTPIRIWRDRHFSHLLQ